MESIWVSNIIDKHNEVSLSKELECNFLEDVLSSDVNAVEFDSVIWVFLVENDILDVVFAALGHHVLMVKLAFDGLIDKAGLSNGGFASYYNTSS